jgi:hypothetical protein
MSAVLSIVAFTAVWLVLGWILGGRIIFAYVPLFIGGFIIWWFTTRKTRIDAQRIIVPYLLTISFFVAHVYEEYKAHVLGFPDVNQGVFELTVVQMWTFAPFLGTLLWLLGAVLMLKRWPLGYFIASTFLFSMMFIECSHYISPFLQDGTFHYVGGMFTAVFVIASAWYVFFRVRGEMNNSALP